jgi:nucleoid DNA-binding protein|tara:strand:+ start:430 stop:564 length:135 start_codon:yes stop_codon:yes gene_type:complete
MISTSEIKKELISIIVDYKQTMSKDLEQALENLHDEIESDKEDE